MRSNDEKRVLKLNYIDGNSHQNKTRNGIYALSLPLPLPLLEAKELKGCVNAWLPPPPPKGPSLDHDVGLFPFFSAD